MIMKKLMIASAIALAVWALQAEPYNTKAGLGLHFGTSSGNGYSMRLCGKKHGVQFTIGAYTTGNNNPSFDTQMYFYDASSQDSVITYERNGREKSFTGAINYLLFLDDFKTGRLYLMMGGAYTYNERKVFSMDYRRDSVYGNSYYYNVIPDTDKNWIKAENRWTVGIGPGFDFSLGKKFRLSFEVPLTYNFKDEIVMYIPQVGLYYYFK
jgi:hypothetical protein